jgi:hypothetical protein
MNLLPAVLVLQAAVSHPVVVGSLTNPNYTIELESGGRKLTTLFAPDRLASLVGAPTKPGVVTFQLPTGQSLKVRVSSFSKGIPNSQAILGYGVLKTGSIGVDFAAKHVYYWPSGLGGRVDAENWVASGKADNWPAATGVARANLTFTKEGGVAIEATIKGKLSRLRPLVGGYGTILAAFPESFSQVPSPLHFAYNIVLGGQKIDWMFLTNSFYKKPFGPLTGGYDGALSCEDFFSQRVLIDFPSGGVYFQNLSGDGRATNLMNAMTRSPAAIHAGSVVIGGYYLPYELRPFVGQSITSIAGVDSKGIVGALSSPSARSAGFLEDLFLKTRPAYEARIHLSDGRDEGWDVPAVGSN